MNLIWSLKSACRADIFRDSLAAFSASDDCFLITSWAYEECGSLIVCEGSLTSYTFFDGHNITVIFNISEIWGIYKSFAGFEYSLTLNYSGLYSIFLMVYTGRISIAVILSANFAFMLRNNSLRAVYSGTSKSASTIFSPIK